MRTLTKHKVHVRTDSAYIYIYIYMIFYWIQGRTYFLGVLEFEDVLKISNDGPAKFQNVLRDSLLLKKSNINTVEPQSSGLL